MTNNERKNQAAVFIPYRQNLAYAPFCHFPRRRKRCPSFFIKPTISTKIHPKGGSKSVRFSFCPKEEAKTAISDRDSKLLITVLYSRRYSYPRISPLFLCPLRFVSSNLLLCAPFSFCLKQADTLRSYS